MKKSQQPKTQKTTASRKHAHPILKKAREHLNSDSRPGSSNSPQSTKDTECIESRQTRYANAATSVILAELGKESVASAHSLIHRWASSSATWDISEADLTTVLLAGPVAKAIDLEEGTAFPVTPESVRFYVSKQEAETIPKGWRRVAVLRSAIDKIRKRWEPIREVAGKLADGYTVSALGFDGAIQKFQSKGDGLSIIDDYINGTRTVVMSDSAG